MKFFWNDANRYCEEKLDCVVRALSISAGVDYAITHGICTELGRKPRHKTKSARHTVEIVNRFGGFRLVKRSGTVGKFVEANPLGNYFVQVRGHAFALIDGTVHDMAPPGSPRTRIINAWQVDKNKISIV